MQEITDSFGWPAAVGLVIGAVIGIVIKNFYIGLGLGVVGAFVYVFVKHKQKTK